MKRAQIIFSAINLPVDLLMLVLAGISAYYLRTSELLSQIRPVLFELSMPFDRYLGLVLFISFFCLVVFAISGLYSMDSTGYKLNEAIRISVAVSSGILIIIFYIFLRGQFFDSRFIILAAWVLAVVYVNLGRIIVRIFQHYLVGKHDIGIHKVIVIGDDEVSKDISNSFELNPSLGYRVVKKLLKPDLDHLSSILDETTIDEIILANPNLPQEIFINLYNFCQENRINFKFVPNLFETMTLNVEMDVSAGVPIIEFKKTALDGWGRILKRTMDIIGPAILLILLSPLFLVMAIIIKLDSEGPIFVKLKRISQGKIFLLWKFRSMVKNAESLKSKLIEFNERSDGPLFKMKNDPRITKVGRILRKTRIDEFPQLINALKGDISLVGPRPHQPDEIVNYKLHHKKVLNMKPGITGLAQISGASELPFEEEVKLDVYYMENWSLKLDLYILLKTIIVMFTDKSAC